ncbi:Gfo/Idh/MocA family oxidoreductase [Gammaproteobacteria bacterium]|nr:Gfo/Idh/MocA family oxidoreductase [Gammaproteobacteria bacterium]
MKFSIIGPSGYIAKRHLAAISSLESTSIYSYLDLQDSDFPVKTKKSKFFNDQENFFQDLQKNCVDFLVICSPNHLHFSQILRSVEIGIPVICEKPICINHRDLEVLSLLPDDKRNLIHSIMQLRLHPVVDQIQDLISSNHSSIIADIQFVTRRNDEYKKSWKVKREFSGGILFNLGIHYFDLLFNVLGQPLDTKIETLNDFTAKGLTCFSRGQLNWFFSIDDMHLTETQNTIREFSIDNTKIDFSKVSEDLHHLNYLEIINNNKFKFKEMYNVHQYIANLYKHV